MKKILSLSVALCAMSAFAGGSDLQQVQIHDTTTTITTRTVYQGGQTYTPAARMEGNSVFKNGYFKVSYVNESLKPVTAGSLLNLQGGETEIKSDWGVALDWGGMQCFTGDPIEDMVNIGLDIHLALAYANYKDGANVGEYQKPVLADLHHGSVGIGIGPAVAVAPFAKLDFNILRHLTVKAFYHFTPSYSALFYKDADDKAATKGGFCLYQSFGLELGYRRLGLGFETVKGKAKYNDLDVSGILGDGASNTKGEKQKIESPAFRLFVAYKF